MPQMIDGVATLPVGVDPLGNDLISGYMERIKPHAVISLVDVWGLNPELWGQGEWYPWTPIDHLPPPPSVIEALRYAQRPIAMSAYGVEQLRQTGL